MLYEGGETMAKGSTLTMGNATYARDEAGLKALKANITGDIDRAIKTLSNCNEYESFISTIQKNWSGEDATKYINQFKKAVSNLANTYKTYKTTVTTALDKDIAQFKSMQSTNASKIAGTAKTFK